MHYAAMAENGLPVIEWLAARGLTADDKATFASVSPLQVALEYKRLAAARRLQQLCDMSQAGTPPSPPLPPPPAAHGSPNAASARPAPRFPSWIIAGADSGGLDVAELEGDSPDVAAQAARLAARSEAFVWRRAALCPAFPKALKQGLEALGPQTLDTNICRGRDRKFVYFNPKRLQNGPYDPVAVDSHFAPMRLNEQLKLEETLDRLRRLAADDVLTATAAASTTATAADDALSAAASASTTVTAGMALGNERDSQPHERAGGTAASAAKVPGRRMVGEGGWLVTADAKVEGAPFVMAKLLEAASATEADMLKTRGARIPAHLRPGIAMLSGLAGEQFALWTKALEPIARPVAEATAWPRLGKMASAAGWGSFEQAGLLISGRDSLTPTHYDAHHNVFLQLSGAKRFLLFAPDQVARGHRPRARAAGC